MGFPKPSARSLGRPLLSWRGCHISGRFPRPQRAGASQGLHADTRRPRKQEPQPPGPRTDGDLIVYPAEGRAASFSPPLRLLFADNVAFLQGRHSRRPDELAQVRAVPAGAVTCPGRGPPSPAAPAPYAVSEAGETPPCPAMITTWYNLSSASKVGSMFIGWTPKLKRTRIKGWCSPPRKCAVALEACRPPNAHGTCRHVRRKVSSVLGETGDEGCGFSVSGVWGAANLCPCSRCPVARCEENCPLRVLPLSFLLPGLSGCEMEIFVLN